MWLSKCGVWIFVSSRSADEIAAWAWRCRHFFSHRRQRALVFTRFRIARSPCTEQKRGTFRKKTEDFWSKAPRFAPKPSAFSFAFFGLFSLFSPNPSMNPGRALVSVGEKAESRVPRVTINAYLCRTLLLFSSIRSLRAVPDGAISCLCLLLPALPSAP